jgi:1-acyl-sn-glycerol-3-phosphate acyltransferase
VIATIAEVRAEMVERQRAWARARGGGVLEGRDIATVVFPDAPVRIFLTADVEERARRRHAEQPDRSFDDVVADLKWRDHNDSSRDVAPLSVAAGATVLDTTGLSLEQVVDRAVETAQAGLAEAARVSSAPKPVARETPPRGPSVAERRLWASIRPFLLGVVKVYFRATWEGMENIPKSGPVIIAPVHRSNIDTVVVPFLARRRVRFLGKSSMWKIAPIGRLFTKLGAIKVERGTADRESMNLCLDALRNGEPLVVYPEGTRKEGPVVEELFDGVAWLAARTQATIVPVGIGGSADAMGRAHKFPRPHKVHLIVGRPIPPPATTGRKGLRTCTTELQTELQELFDAAQVKVYGHVPPGPR